MTTTTNASGRAWRALALCVVPGLLLAAIVLPTVLLLSRLPGQHASSPRAFSIAWGPLVRAYGALFVTIWVGVLVVYLASSPGRDRRRGTWERGVPILTIAGGLGAWLLDGAVLANVDRTQAVPFDVRDDPRLVGITVMVVLLGGAAGLLLGRQAMRHEPVDEHRPTVRAVWMRDVSAAPSWWLLQALGALGFGALFAIPAAELGARPGAIASGAIPAAAVLLVAAWASTGWVSVSPAGIRVRCGHLVPYGWQLGIDQIAAVETVRVHVPRPRLGRRSLILRDGPALLIRTRQGGRRWITVPDAEEAAALLRGWMPPR